MDTEDINNMFGTVEYKLVDIETLDNLINKNE